MDRDQPLCSEDAAMSLSLSQPETRPLKPKIDDEEHTQNLDLTLGAFVNGILIPNELNVDHDYQDYSFDPSTSIDVLQGPPYAGEPFPLDTFHLENDIVATSACVYEQAVSASPLSLPEATGRRFYDFDTQPDALHQEGELTLPSSSLSWSGLSTSHPVSADEEMLFAPNSIHGHVYGSQVPVLTNGSLPSESHSITAPGDITGQQFMSHPDDDDLFPPDILSSYYLSSFGPINDSRRSDPTTTFRPGDQTPSPEVTMMWEDILDYGSNSNTQDVDGGVLPDQTMELFQAVPTNMGKSSMSVDISNLWGDTSAGVQFRTYGGQYLENPSREPITVDDMLITRFEADGNAESRVSPTALQLSTSTIAMGPESQSPTVTVDAGVSGPASPRNRSWWWDANSPLSDGTGSFSGPSEPHFTSPSSQPGSLNNPGDASPLMTCINCHTKVSPLWRRDPQGQPLCNACGFFFKLHGEIRPLKKRPRTVKDDNRCTKRGSGAGQRVRGIATKPRKNENNPAANGGGFLLHPS